MITVTENAVRMVRRIMEKEGRQGGILRIGVKGGGCSGFSYHMEFTDAARPQDERYEFHGLQVVVDPRSLELLRGIELDYPEGIHSGFRWANPNATRSCGCGESFSVLRRDAEPAPSGD
jgi:iron-sulfur cluster assembly protein